MAMAVLAAGHNAWGQLSFGGLDGVAVAEESGDIFTFAKVLQGGSLSRPRARLAYTLVSGKDGFHHAGIRRDPDIPDPELFAEAANGVILAAADQPRILARYKHRGDYLQNKTDKTWPCKSPVLDIVPYNAGFAVLYRDGTVATLGDARYQDCLARQVTDEEPADEPGLVPDLKNLGDPVKHVSAAGCAIVALTESGSLYVWGRASPSRGAPQAFNDICGIPNYMEVGEGKDVRDVALGESHAITMTTDGTIYVKGGNANGQLGLGLRGDEAVDTWTEVNFDVPGHKPVSVSAGPRTSFILVSRA